MPDVVLDAHVPLPHLLGFLDLFELARLEQTARAAYERVRTERAKQILLDVHSSARLARAQRHSRDVLQKSIVWEWPLLVTARDTTDTYTLLRDLRRLLEPPRAAVATLRIDFKGFLNPEEQSGFQRLLTLILALLADDANAIALSITLERGTPAMLFCDSRSTKVPTDSESEAPFGTPPSHGEGPSRRIWRRTLREGERVRGPIPEGNWHESSGESSKGCAHGVPGDVSDQRTGGQHNDVSLHVPQSVCALFGSSHLGRSVPGGGNKLALVHSGVHCLRSSPPLRLVSREDPARAACAEQRGGTQPQETENAVHSKALRARVGSARARTRGKRRQMCGASRSKWTFKTAPWLSIGVRVGVMLFSLAYLPVVEAQGLSTTTSKSVTSS